LYAKCAFFVLLYVYSILFGADVRGHLARRLFKQLQATAATEAAVTAKFMSDLSAKAQAYLPRLDKICRIDGLRAERML
jgi:hypothetical protein